MSIAILLNGQICPLPDWSKVPWAEKWRKDAEKQLKDIEKDETTD